MTHNSILLHGYIRVWILFSLGLQSEISSHLSFDIPTKFSYIISQICWLQNHHHDQLTNTTIMYCILPFYNFVHTLGNVICPSTTFLFSVLQNTILILVLGGDTSSEWRHMGVIAPQSRRPINCFVNSYSGLTSWKTQKHHATAPLHWYSTDERWFPSQSASNAESFPFHDITICQI